jgi:hypothetical protein
MTRGEFMSAISRLTVRSGHDGFVMGRPIYLQAAGAFNRAGHRSWLWFAASGPKLKRPPTPRAIDEAQARIEFVEWLERASETDIARFVEDADRYYRPALIKAGRETDALVRRERAAFGEAERKFERGGVLRGAEGRTLWRTKQLEAGEIAQRSKIGELSGESRRRKTGERVLREAHKLLAGRKAPPSRNDAADKIAERLKHDPEKKQVDRILGRLAGDPTNELPSEWIPRKNRSP